MHLEVQYQAVEQRDIQLNVQQQAVGQQLAEFQIGLLGALGTICLLNIFCNIAESFRLDVQLNNMSSDEIMKTYDIWSNQHLLLSNPPATRTSTCYILHKYYILHTTCYILHALHATALQMRWVAATQDTPSENDLRVSQCWKELRRHLREFSQVQSGLVNAGTASVTLVLNPKFSSENYGVLEERFF